MRKRLRIIGVIVYRLLVLMVVLLAGLMLLSTFGPNKLTTGLFVVQSGSMQPAISVGSLIMTRKAESYSKGDVITYSPSIKKITPIGLTTHRIVEIRETAHGQEFVTKGDANNATDSAAVKKEQILGKVVLAFPYLGYPISFTKTLPGLILVIVIPATIIIYQELLNLKNDILKRLALRRKEARSEGEKE